ncbi:MAG: hypothetical protein EOP06_02375 [Proteobacteria bacterium]|nr:MAG: hypothetical protein EOP06_02375 [Pseudomonadota bacterium]
MSEYNPSLLAGLGEDFVCRFFSFTPLVKQGFGTGYDATDSNGRKIEIKCDLRSSETGNYYLEYKQVCLNNLVSESGISLACQSADLIYLVSHKRVLVLQTVELREWLEKAKQSLRSRRTTIGKNGNSQGNYSVGLIVPEQTIKDLAVEGYRCVDAFTETWNLQIVKGKR